MDEGLPFWASRLVLMILKVEVEMLTILDVCYSLEFQITRGSLIQRNTKFADLYIC